MARIDEAPDIADCVRMVESLRLALTVAEPDLQSSGRRSPVDFEGRGVRWRESRSTAGENGSRLSGGRTRCHGGSRRAEAIARAGERLCGLRRRGDVVFICSLGDSQLDVLPVSHIENVAWRGTKQRRGISQIPLERAVADQTYPFCIAVNVCMFSGLSYLSSGPSCTENPSLHSVRCLVTFSSS